MRIVLIGIPGAGKSTQGNLLSKQLDIPYLSTGHIFRQIAKEKTKLGRYVKETINAGLLIPDDKTLQIVSEYLKRPEYRKGYILDGFPRTLKQAQEFKEELDKVFYLKVPDKEALWRLAYRNDNLREDDTLQAIKKRIELFHEVTEPVLDYYDKKGLLVVIDGTKSIEEVNKEILNHLGKQLKGNKIKDLRRRKKAIIAIVGLPGAGKSTAADYFRRKGLPVVSFSDVINKQIDEAGLPHTEEVHKKFRTEIRKKYGMGALAIVSKEAIEKALKDNSIIVIEGMRSWEEYEELKKSFPNLKIYILYVWADKEKRYERIKKREYRGQLYGEERDKNEILSLNMGPTIAMSDFIVKNNFSLQEFYDKLEEVYRQVYFSL